MLSLQAGTNIAITSVNFIQKQNKKGANNQIAFKGGATSFIKPVISKAKNIIKNNKDHFSYQGTILFLPLLPIDQLFDSLIELNNSILIVFISGKIFTDISEPIFNFVLNRINKRDGLAMLPPFGIKHNITNLFAYPWSALKASCKGAKWGITKAANAVSKFISEKNISKTTKNSQ